LRNLPRVSVEVFEDARLA